MPLLRRLSASAWLLIGCTALGAVLRFLFLDRQSIWVDEAFSIKFARLFTSLDPRHFLDDFHGPLHSLLLHGWAKMFGTSEFALRSLEALCSTATIPAFAWALQPLKRPAAAKVAVFLLAINPFHIWYAQEIRNYALFMLLTTLSSGIFVRLGQGGTGRTWGYGVVNFLAFHANLAHLFTLLTHGLAQAVTGWRDWSAWRRLLRTWVLTGVLMIPWIVGFYHHYVEDTSALTPGPIPTEELKRGETTAPAAGIPYAFFVYSLGYSYGPSLRELRTLSHDFSFSPLVPHLPALLFAGFVFAPLALVGVWRLVRAGKDARVWVLLLVVPVLATLAVASRNVKVFNPRYASAAVPAYVLALAEGLTAPRRRTGFALGTLLVAPTAVSLAQHYQDPRYAKEDARSAARFLQSEVRPGDYIFVIGTDEPLERYYWRGLRKNPGGVTKGDVGYWFNRAPAEKFALFETERAGRGRAFVLFLREHFADPEGVWRRYLDEHHPPLEKVQFPGVEIWELPPASAVVGT